MRLVGQLNGIRKYHTAFCLWFSLSLVVNGQEYITPERQFKELLESHQSSL